MKTTLPEYFKQILWEYDFSAVDPEESPKLLIERAINYGDLRHWRWILKRYGAERVRHVLTSLPATAIRPGARTLAEIVFSIPHFNVNVASRGSHA